MQNCLILGAGVSGIAAAKLLIDKQKNVYIHDKDKRKLRELYDAKIIDNQVNLIEKFNRKTLQFFDTLVLSPGVKLNTKILQECRLQNIQVLSEIDLASMFCKAPIFAITGTNGKTTTVNYLHQIFVAAGKKSHLLGNVGVPFCGEVDKIDSKSKVVLEVSSFQLEHCTHLECAAAAILNFAPDHLDRYSCYDDYEDTKAHLLNCIAQNGVALLNYDDVRVRSRGLDNLNAQYFSLTKLPPDVKGYYICENKVMQNTGTRTRELIELPELNIRGDHNLSNLLCAIAMAHIAKIKPAQILSALTNLSQPRHRLEFAGEKNGVKFYNDSKATNIHSVKTAIATFSQPIHLLLGGSDKGEDFAKFLSKLPPQVLTVTAFGKMGKKIYRQAKRQKLDCAYFPKLNLAFDYAKNIAEAGDVVLLSPACASFDEFPNFEARGDTFCNLVAEWLSEK